MLLVPFAAKLPLYAFLILFWVFLITGFNRAFNFIPEFVLNQYFDAVDKDKESIRFWFGLNGYGDTIAILSMHVLLKSFNWDWKVCFVIVIVTFYATSLLFYYSTE